MKRFYEQQNIGSSKYVVNHHDGAKKHADGSDFYDIAIFRSRPVKDAFVKQLRETGYSEARHD